MVGPTARVTVGMPVYNGERYLAAAVESFLGQTFTAFHLIISDNASTDETPAIARRYVERDPRVRYVRNPVNVGVAGNYRRVLSLADTEYFRWAAADDLAGPTALARCVEVLDREPAVMLVYPKTMFVDAEGHALRPFEDGLHMESARPRERFRQVLAHLERCNAMYGVTRTAALKAILPLGDFRSADFCLLAELSLRGRFCEVPELLFHRRFHDAASSSFTNDEQFARYFQPDADGRPAMVAWRHYGRNVHGILRAPIPAAEKLALLGYIGRRAVSRRNLLGGELMALLRWTVARSARPARSTADARRARSPRHARSGS